MEISGITLKVMKELATAFSQFTPENIKACGIAEAEALKLTEPERKKRDECAATINSINIKMDELKRLQATHDLKLAEIANAQASLDSRKSLLDSREERHSQAVAAHNINLASYAEREKKLANWDSQLQATAKSQKATEERLKAWEADLNEQASGFEQAQKLIRRK